jgi:NAD(P)-dependent dehydrogenase (short-subunit alcohol dehydrogenase family)
MKVMNKRALVTGASSGLGEAIARRLAADGAKVAITARRKERLEGLARERGAYAIVADHTNEADNARAIDEAVRAFGGLDVLVLNAGVIGFDGALDAKPAEFRRLMEVNVFATYDVLRLAVPNLVKSAESGRDAAVLATSSVASLRPYPGLLGYCTSKAAVDVLVQSAAIELAPKKVRVNAINPGWSSPSCTPRPDSTRRSTPPSSSAARARTRSAALGAPTRSPRSRASSCPTKPAGSRVS